MKKCPNCNKKLYEAVGGGYFCKKCGFRNDPNYLKKNETKKNMEKNE